MRGEKYEFFFLILVPFLDRLPEQNQSCREKLKQKERVRFRKREKIRKAKTKRE